MEILVALIFAKKSQRPERAKMFLDDLFSVTDYASDYEVTA